MPSDTSDPPSPKDALVADVQVPFIMNSESEHHANGDVLSRNGGFSLHVSHSTIHHLWRTFDDTCMRPMFGGCGYVRPSPDSINGNEDSSIH